MKSAACTAVVTIVAALLVGDGQAFRSASSAGSRSWKVFGRASCNLRRLSSPHDEKGEPVKAKWMKGAPLAFKPTVPMPMWADKAPNIAGLPGWEDADAVKFFMTGIAYNDLPARPPMPQYRFNQQDAQAVVAYLKSLAPSGK